MRAHQLGVQRGHAVHLVRAEEGQGAHAHAPLAVLVDQRHRGQRRHVRPGGQRVEMQLVDLVDDLHVARQQPLHQRHRPAFQRLGQQRVVGVGDGVGGDLPGLGPRQAVFVHQQPHQLRDDDRRMRVVELDGAFVGQVVQVAILADVPVQQVLQRCRREEILLPQPQFLARRRFVAGVEDLRYRIGPRPCGQGADVIAAVERLQRQRVRCPRRPQPQRVRVPAAPADDRRVVGDGDHRLLRMPDRRRRAVAGRRAVHPTAEADLVGDIGRSNSHGLPNESQFSGYSCCQPSRITCWNNPWL